MRQRLLLTIALMISIAFFSNFSPWAAVPHTINYQGKLTNADGNALNGEYTMTFRLYRIAEGETSIWDETQRVTVTEGIYNVKLGAENPMEVSLFNNDDKDISISSIVSKSDATHPSVYYPAVWVGTGGRYNIGSI